ncbi:polyketide biosynthesis cytochrome P450 PksS [Mycobacteroides stephanolepidis]|uniref:Polyketide biosynthesis cytochrome P450 PksS n=1 Tax=[Mycobacterium] stephanolepidis TaxID=1520670 RepID=A0A1Z4F0Q4_9MYCO|nr:cytochrome P450 [[Mycobacterium] stephanolepidis]BAX98762.1 polyketide biosynthesis cytochrome P450 PksS [[Mycobacterium] stephanolepidis]
MTEVVDYGALPPFSLTGWAAADVANPYPVYRRYREVAAVHRGTDGTHYLLGYYDVAKALSSRSFGRRAAAAGHPGTAGLVPDECVALRNMVENWLVFLDPPRHTELKSVLAGRFSPAVVAGLRQRIAEIAASLLSRCVQESEFDLVQAFSAPLPILVISELLGVPASDWKWLRDRVKAIQSVSSSRRFTSGAEVFRLADVAAAELSDYFVSQAGERRRAPKDDLVSLMASDGALSSNEIASSCVHLMSAGHETTTNILGKAVLALGADRRVLSMLRASGSVPISAVEELVRFDGPVQSVTRWAYRDVCVAGRDIARGTRVVAVLGAANRDPARFPDPDVLRLDRGAGCGVGFGQGIHYCLGAALARVEIEIGLDLLLDILGEFTVDKVEYPCDMVFHGPSSLVLCRG